MKRILLATTVILPFTASMAFAGNNYLNVTQTIKKSTQAATNEVVASSNAEDLDQTAANIANLVDQAIGGGKVDQDVDRLTQDAINSAITGNRWQKVDQAASNLSNILQGEDFGAVSQSILRLEQTADNEVIAERNFVKRIDQIATNVGNLVSTDGDTQTINQQVGGWQAGGWWGWSPIDGAEQVAVNTVSSGELPVGVTEADARTIEQAASNLLNIVQMDTSGAITQSIKFSSQDASNTITQGKPGAFFDNEQTATNVGNLIEGTSIGATSTQAADGLPQTATNVMNIASGGSPSPVDLDQTATNLTNIVQLAELTTNLSQKSLDGTQTASNTITDTVNTSGTLSPTNTTQIATNATNLVTADIVGGSSISLTQYASGLNQLAENSITGVNSVGMSNGWADQTATNLSNVLTGN